MGNLVTETLVFFVARVYPAHASLLAVQSGSREESVQWLCYWVLYALLASVEEVFEAALEWCERSCWQPTDCYPHAPFAAGRQGPAVRRTQAALPVVGSRAQLQGTPGRRRTLCAVHLTRCAAPGCDALVRNIRATHPCSHTAQQRGARRRGRSARAGEGLALP